MRTKLMTELQSHDDGTNTLRYRRAKDGDALLELRNIAPNGVANTVFGEETLLKSELLGSNEEIVDNRNGVADVDVDFRDLFSKSEGHEDTHEQSAGTSVSVTVTATQEIEGVASFEESVTAEAHAEISESETDTSETTKEDEGEEGTTVPGPTFDENGNITMPGKRVKIVETRHRADTTQEVTSTGLFNFGIAIGKHSGGKFVGHHNGYWDSWQQFTDVVRGDAPDNWDKAQSFKLHHVRHADLSLLDPLDTTVKYEIKFTGKVLRTYTVEAY